jgi:hypothetical protein
MVLLFNMYEIRMCTNTVNKISDLPVPSRKISVLQCITVYCFTVYKELRKHKYFDKFFSYRKGNTNTMRVESG